MSGTLRALVFGGSGMLGRALVAEGRRTGHAVLGLPSAVADVTDGEVLRAWVQRFGPQVIFNCAAFTQVDRCESERDRAFAVNGEAVAHVAAAARAHRVPLVHVSTDYVFDGTATTPYALDAPTAPQSVYGASKLAGEQLALAYERAAVVRTSWLFGPGGPNFVRTMLRLGANATAPRQPVRVVDDQVGCPTYTPFLANALWRLASRLADPATGAAAAGLYHYANREPVSWFGFAREIFHLALPGVDVTPCTTAEFPRPARRPAYSVLAVDRIEAVLGHRVEAWQQGLALYLASSHLNQGEIR